MSLTLPQLTRDMGGSMLELCVIDEEEDEDSPRFKESKGLLRRAFSSTRRRRKRKDFVSNVSPGGSSLMVSAMSPAACSCLLTVPFSSRCTQNTGLTASGSQGR